MAHTHEENPTTSSSELTHRKQVKIGLIAYPGLHVFITLLLFILKVSLEYKKGV